MKSKTASRPWVWRHPLRTLAIAAMSIGAFMLLSFAPISLAIGSIANETGSSGDLTVNEAVMLAVGLLLLVVGFFTFGSTPPRRRGRRLAVLVVGGVVLVSVAAWAFVQVESSVLVHSRKGLGVAYFRPIADNPTVTDQAFAGLEDKTAENCNEELACIQAFESDRLSLYRFAERSEAAALATSLGENGYQSDWIVVKFTDPSLSDDLRLYVMQALDGTWSKD